MLNPKPQGLTPLDRPSTYENYEWRCGIFINVKSALHEGNDMIDGTGAYMLDGFFSAQSVGNSFLHAMRAPGQSAAEARFKMFKFIFDRLDKARERAQRAQAFYEAGNKSAAKSSIETAVKIIGQAQHPIADSTSPQHRNFQVWKGIINPCSIPAAWRHHKSETREEYDAQTEEPFITVKAFFDSSLSEILK